MPKTPPTNFKPAPNLGRELKGLVIINTGNGKGKSTAGFGTMFRAWGRGMNICAIQFIKSEKSQYGEQLAAEKIGIEIMASGRGLTGPGGTARTRRARRAVRSTAANSSCSLTRRERLLSPVCLTGNRGQRRVIDAGAGCVSR